MTFPFSFQRVALTAGSNKTALVYQRRFCLRMLIFLRRVRPMSIMRFSSFWRRELWTWRWPVLLSITTGREITRWRSWSLSQTELSLRNLWKLLSSVKMSGSVAVLAALKSVLLFLKTRSWNLVLLMGSMRLRRESEKRQGSLLLTRMETLFWILAFFSTSFLLEAMDLLVWWRFCLRRVLAMDQSDLRSMETSEREVMDLQFLRLRGCAWGNLMWVRVRQRVAESVCLTMKCEESSKMDCWDRSVRLECRLRVEVNLMETTDRADQWLLSPEDSSSPDRWLGVGVLLFGFSFDDFCTKVRCTRVPRRGLSVRITSCSFSFSLPTTKFTVFFLDFLRSAGLESSMREWDFSSEMRSYLKKVRCLGLERRV